MMGDEADGRLIGIPVFGFVKRVKDWGGTRVLILLLFNVTFILTSSFAFMKIENTYLPEYVISRHKELQYLLEMMSNHNEQYNVKHNEISSSYWQEMVEVYRPRCRKINNRHTENNLWNFWSSLDFCATVLTTIG